MTTLEEGPEIQAMWCSFLPALTRALLKSTGPILEIGIGHFSTPFLHEWSRVTGREFMSVEANADWAARFAHCQSDLHAVAIGSYSDVLPQFSNEPWGVVFIDGSPGGKARADQFRMFFPISDFVVVHDYHKENSEAIEPYLLNLKYAVYDEYQPPTLLAWK